jgi:hypothetical protein
MVMNLTSTIRATTSVMTNPLIDAIGHLPYIPSQRMQEKNSQLGFGAVFKRFFAYVISAALLLLAMVTFAQAAQLNLADGVVVKFGEGAQLVVRDRLTGQGAILTSQKDDNVAGQTNAVPQTPAAGDWRGLRLEKSSAAFGSTTLNGFTMRYAGATSGADQEAAAALIVRGLNPALQYLQITDNRVGLLLLDGSSPTITGSNFQRNIVGILAEGNSAPTISSTQFVQNSSQAILNETPTTLIEATGNWWGHSSGPNDPVDNPQGQGDPVSTGVNYGNYLTAAPLLNPTVQLVAPATYFTGPTVAINVSCVNATEYRLAEEGAFADVAFEPLTYGRAEVQYAVSAGDGHKSLSAQFRNTDGVIATASLSGGFLIDTEDPFLEIVNPIEGSVITEPIRIEGSASDASGISRVDFFLNGQKLASQTSAPYSYDWDNSESANGAYTIGLVAVDEAGRSTEVTRNITLTHASVGPDTQGPVLSEIIFNGSAVTNGMTLSQSGILTLKAIDPSGVASVQITSSGQTITMDSSSDGDYSAAIDLSRIPNGNYTLVISAKDSLNNLTTNTYSIKVAHAAPLAPVLSSPVNGLVTPTATQTVAGTAQINSTVTILVNGQVMGTSLTVGSDGGFSSSITLSSGENLIQATASDAFGTSPPSTVVKVTVEFDVPTSPGLLSASAQIAGKVRLTWSSASDPKVVGYDLYSSTSPFTSIGEASKVNTTSPITGTTYDDIPLQDGIWYYRLVSVNASGVPSAPTNQAQVVSDSTLPKALSIVYTPQGKVDTETGRTGQGRVDLVVTFSETLQTIPYLAIVPQGGSPITIELVKVSDVEYTGNFQIGADTPSGTANAILSARDRVGNRGTEIITGATFAIDTDGPVLSAIELVPAAPIKNDTAQTVQITLTMSKAVKTGTVPQIRYILSGPGRSPVVVDGLSAIDATTWRANIILPSDAGQDAPEILSFTQQSIDDLENVATKVAAFNRFQVYQGDLPPLDIPLGLTAKAQAGGKVLLAWQVVDYAAAYQIYRQGPEETELQPLTRSGGESYLDQTPQDGVYKYAIASVRENNGQEALSGQSATVEVKASATAPGAPQNLTLQLTGQGIYASWQPPLASTVEYYNLYRENASISSIEGLTPLKTGIKGLATYDINPSTQGAYYAVTALDAAGNESAISIPQYFNSNNLLPVRNLRIEQIDNLLPVIFWDAPNGNLAGYNVYVGRETERTKLTPSPIAERNFTDSGYTGGERWYTVASVDSNQDELERIALLPNVVTQIASGLPIKRGIMNKLQVQVANASSSALENLQVIVRLPINADATQFKDHKSAAFTLEANQTVLVPVIVGGYAELPGAPKAQVGVEIAAYEDELVKIAREQTISTTEGSLVVGMATDTFTRGGTGKVTLTIENTTEVDIELLTATNHGNDASNELRFKILDNDGNVLATQSFKQIFGANVVTLTNGLTVARIPAGSSYTSDAFAVNIPAASPNSIRLKLEVDKLRYHSGQADEVIITGHGSEKVVSLVDTTYVGEVTDVTPVSSFGDQDIVITGRAFDRASGAALPNTHLKLIFNQQGFERSTSILTDATGSFVYTFKPTLTDAGLYKVSAVHPDITDRPEQKNFNINRVTVNPTPYKLNVPRNYTYSIPFVAKAGVGTSATNLRLELDAAEQPSGQLPTGITVQFASPVSLVERQNLNIPVSFTADNTAQPSGALVFNVISQERSEPIGQVRLDYTLSEAKPFLTSTPSIVETGMAQNGSQFETVVVENKGLEDALDLQFTLSKADGGAMPSWASISNTPDGTLAIGERRTIDLSFAPSASIQEGVYAFKLTVQGSNLPAQSLNVFASITQSGQGGILFKASDIYTATLDKNGRLIAGLANATITVQNEDVPSISHQLATDELGEALFQNLPAGRYTYRAKASNHQELGGRFQIKPGITVNQPIFLEYTLVTIEWSVREITIEDRYEINLNATYETDVPAAVLLMQPLSINLPKMNTGDVYYGELTLTNYGLIRADDVKMTPPQNDAYFRYEFLVDVPSSIEAKQRVTLPYRVIALKSLDTASTDGDASGGGCYTYTNHVQVGGKYICQNGTVSFCSAGSSFVSASNTTCPGGGGSGGSNVGGKGGWGTLWGHNGWGGPTGGGYQSVPGLPPCTKCDGVCCGSSGGGGGSSAGGSGL